MTNLINNDNTNGLTYYNYINGVGSGQVFSPSSFLSAINTRWGANKSVIDSGLIYCLPNPGSPLENKTGPADILTNYRGTLVLPTSTGARSTVLNCSSNSAGSILVTSPSVTSVGTTMAYGVITNKTVSYCSFNNNGATLLDSTWKLAACGWLEDTPFADNEADRFRGLFSLMLQSNGQLIAFRPSMEDTTVSQMFFTTGPAQYEIVCSDGQTAGSNLWATDLWLRDSPSGYAIGRVPHILYCRTNTLSITDKVRIDHPSLVLNEQKTWIVGADWGSHKLLHRVFGEEFSDD